MGSWSTSSATDLDYHHCAAAHSDGKIYLFGGSVFGANFTRMFDPVAQTFTNKANTPFNVFDGAALSFGGYIWVLGGNGENRFARYNPVANSWQLLSFAPFNMSSVCMYADANGDIWAWGGSGGNTPTAVIMKYTMSTNQWTQHGSGIYDHQHKGWAKGPDELFYSMGGLISGTGTTTVQRFNPVTLAIESLAPLPAVRWAGVASERGGLVHYISGNSTSANSAVTTTNYAYDPITNTWSTKTAIPIGRRQGAVATLGPSIYVFGGRNNNTTQSVLHVWTEPLVLLGAISASATASTTAYAVMSGAAVAEATAVVGDIEVAWMRSGQADSFIDVGDTGSDSFDALDPSSTLYPDTTLYPSGDF